MVPLSCFFTDLTLGQRVKVEHARTWNENQHEQLGRQRPRGAVQAPPAANQVLFGGCLVCGGGDGGGRSLHDRRHWTSWDKPVKENNSATLQHRYQTRNIYIYPPCTKLYNALSRDINHSTRDLAQNWDVDIASSLEDYLEDLEDITITLGGGASKVNFAEAALLIQVRRCCCVHTGMVKTHQVQAVLTNFRLLLVSSTFESR